MTLRKTALVGTIATALAMLSAIPAFAGSPNSVGKVAASWTPWLLSSPAPQQVEQLAPCGANMYAVGTISAIGQGTSTYTRGNGFSFSQTTGAMTSWDPQVNGEIRSIALSPDCSRAYLGGKFTMVHGTAVTNFVAVDTVTGAVIPTFKAPAPAMVNTVLYTPQGVLIGGNFTKINKVTRTYFASVDPTTGALTPYANLSISGAYPKVPSKIYNMQLSHSGTRLLVEGVFTSINGQPRQQMAVFDLGSTGVTLDNWYAPEFNTACIESESFYARTGAWSPDDSTIYAATTGYHPNNGRPDTGLCDAASSFPSTATTVSHTWINYTGCDSLYSVVADAGQVYIGGHERWANNPGGCDSAGPGALARPGIASLSVTTGLATTWNPTRSLGFGADDLVLTPAGLWIASDTFTTGQQQNCAHQGNHGGICFLPY